MPPGITPATLHLTCPQAAQGQTTNVEGEYDPQSLASAAHVSGAAWALTVALVVCICYNWTRLSLSARFVMRWWIFLAIAALAGSVIVAMTFAFWPMTALANSCQSDPRAFMVSLPGSMIWNEALAALAYGGLLFVVLSILFTGVLGRFAHARNGFFHNRGCPIPRPLP